MIELNIHEPAYEETDGSFSGVTDEASLHADTGHAAANAQDENDIFEMARGIADRAYRFRAKRRSSSII